MSKNNILNDQTKEIIIDKILQGVEPKYIINDLNEMQVAIIDMVIMDEASLENLKDWTMTTHLAIALLCEIS